MVSAQELASIQADAVAATCDQPCVIQRATIASDGAGQETETYNTIATTVAGVAEPTAGQLANYDAEIGDLEAVQVKLPVNTDVKAQDHLIIGGQTLEVHIPLTPRSYPSLLTVIAAIIK